MTCRSACIVGGDSLIGSALAARLRREGWDVTTTTRRLAGDPSSVRLDLAADPRSVDARLGGDVAFLCAGATRIEDCTKHPMATRRVNVLALEELTERLVERGSFVVALSVNQVFDGTRPHVRTDAPTAPRSEYGRQKAELERRLARWSGSVGVVRMTKVLGPSYSVLDSWAGAWRRGEVARPFSDLVMAPVSLTSVVDALARLAEVRRPGIYHLSATRDLTYDAAARLGAAALGVSPDAVRPVTVGESGVELEHIPLHTTLDCEGARQLLGFEPSDPEPLVAGYFQRWREANHDDEEA